MGGPEDQLYESVDPAGKRGGREMFGINHAEESRRRLKLRTGSKSRLARGRAIVVICVLSLLSWAVLIAVIIALRALF